MKVIFFMWHVVLAIESILLMKQRFRKKGTLLLGMNTILFIYHIFFFQNISNMILDVKDILNHTFFTGFLFVLYNTIVIFYVTYLLYSLKNRRRLKKSLFFLIYLIEAILILYFILLLFQNQAIYLYFVIFLWSLYFFIKKFLEKNKSIYIGIFLLFFVLGSYTFFTYTGAARFSIALQGYVKEAYETGLEELNFLQEKNIRKYSPIQNIDENINIIEVRKYILLKVGRV